MRKFFKTGDCIIAEFELFWNMVELNFQNWGRCAAIAAILILG